jgi:aldehyde dehydrogenase (NAD+)
VARSIEIAKKKKVGDPTEADTENGPQISQKQLSKIMNYIDIGKKEGAKLLTGGNRVDRPGFFVETTVFGDVQDDMTIA